MPVTPSTEAFGLAAGGLVVPGYFALKLINERRQLKRALRLSQTEVSSLRSLPLSDAD